jgi:geranylgeranyl transferase type-2 subunit alpha
VLQKDTHLFNLQSFQINSEFLTLNPDAYTLWNYRKEMVLHWIHEIEEIGKADSSTSAEGTAAPAAPTVPLPTLIRGELTLTAAAIKRNPKSYNAWFHRQWFLQQPIIRANAPLADELGLCNKLLDLDERNFHCWNYRRWVAGMAGATLASEIEYTLHRIKKNFSNYSAWHYRSILLTRQFSATPDAASTADATAAMPLDTGSYLTPQVVVLPLSILKDESSLLIQALFTEPDDQSAWFYNRWVVDRLKDVIQGGGVDVDGAIETLLSTAESIQELSNAEPRCKCKWNARKHVSNGFDSSI